MQGETTCVLSGDKCRYGTFSESREFYFYEKDDCFDYYISRLCLDKIKTEVSQQVLLQCRKIMVDSFKKGIIPMFLRDRDDNVECDHKSKQNIYINELENIGVTHNQKPVNLLKIHASKSRVLGPFESHRFTKYDMFECLILDEAELKEWVNHLCLARLIKSQTGEFEAYMDQAPDSSAMNIFNYHFKITTSGWNFIEENFKGDLNNNVFIAMSFGIEGRVDIQTAISNACTICGFNASTVDLEHYQGGITDKIIAMINEAKFVICDFTENKHGVYYEAGYSEGLGKTTIYTVKEGDDLKNLHFDTKHLNHILWETPADLEEKLVDRIKALFKK